MDKLTKEKFKQREEQLEIMRLTVVEQELSARSWKAYYDKMYYSMECEKLEPDYKAHQERVQKRLEEEREAFDKLQKALNDELQKQNQPEVKLEEAN